MKIAYMKKSGPYDLGTTKPKDILGLCERGRGEGEGVVRRKWNVAWIAVPSPWGAVAHEGPTRAYITVHQ